MSDRFEDVMTLMHSLRDEGDDFCLVTIVRTADATSAKAGAKALVTQHGDLHGFVGGSCVQGAVKKAATQALLSGEPALIRIKPKEEVVEAVDVDGVALYKSSCPSGGTVDLFIEPVRQRLRVIVCGVSPVAQSLLKLAHAMGYQTFHAALAEDLGTDDVSTEGHDSTKLPDFDLSSADIRKRDCVVVATQGKRDRQALSAALNSKADYVSMIGSRKKIETLKEQLTTEITPDRLRLLDSPAGLDLGAVDAPEIALSVLSEILAIRRGRTVAISHGADVESVDGKKDNKDPLFSLAGLTHAICC
ncbi:MAG: XdhC family protein [Stappiaceae bacterium]